VHQVAKERVQIPDAVAEIANRIERRILQIRPFRAQMQPDHALRGCNRFITDPAFSRSMIDRWILNRFRHT
jgi:hypothetical protein